MIALIITGVVVLLIAYAIISNYNVLSMKHNQIENAKSSLDALFIKRSDLIPNLIATVKQYMTFEKDTLEKITALRVPSRNNTSENYLEDNENNQLFKQIMVQVENYPELKSNQQFNNLQYSFNECEEQISAGRRFLSTSITDYNNSVTTIPGNLIAGFTGFKKYEWQQATEVQRQNINASDLFNK